MKNELTSNSRIKFRSKSEYKFDKINYHVYSFYDNNHETVKEKLRRLIIQDAEKNFKLTRLQ